MISRRLLYLDTQRLTAYEWKQGRLQAEGVFEMRTEEYARFGQYLREHAQSHFQLLANVAEEGHEQETIPFLQGADRKALIARKLGQHFLGSPLTLFTSLGYEKDKRKNERLLLSALTNPAHFAPWVEAFQQADAALAGIYTLPQLSGRLLKKLDKPDQRALLLTFQDHSIRESFIVGGHAMFSRMAPLFDSSIAGIASRLGAEATKLHQYLVGRRHLGRNDTLTVYVLAHPQAVGAVRHACVDTHGLHFEVVDSHLAARKLNLKTLPGDTSSELIFLHLLAASPPSQQYAPEPWRHDYRISQLRHGLLGLAATALLGGTLFAAKQIYDAYSFNRQTQELNTAEADLNWRYREIAATFPQLGIDKEALRRITDRQNELLNLKRSPHGALHTISRALSEMPNINLDALEWSVGDGKQSNTVALKELLSKANSAEHEHIVLRGTIRLGPGSTPRQTLATFDHFLGLLRAEQELEVHVVQQPFEIESAHALRGTDVDMDTTAPRQFAVQIVRKAKP